MRQFATIRSLFFSLLLVFLFAPVATKAAWSQSAPAPTPAQQAAASTAALPTAAPASSLGSGSVATNPGSSTPATNSAVPATGPALAIGGGDLLKISVFGAPDSDQEVRVDPDGNANLNFIGSVHLGGLTTNQAETLVAKKLSDGGFYTHPQVTVFAKEYATQGVSVLGEVQKPGVYPLLGSRRLFDVLSLAGGTSQKAGRIVSITRRDHPETPTTVYLSNDAAESAKSNVEIFAGDTVMVSRAGVVYVVGDVGKPSGVIMDNGTDMTVLQAIAMAQGTQPTAALNKAKLIRKTPNGPQEMPLALKDMLASKAPDVRLQAEDIIFVPNSAAKSAGRRTLEAIIQSATGLAVYGVVR
jgi:polysaccharide export outer membrane protein